MPSAKVPTGKSITFKEGFAVADPADIDMSVAPNFADFTAEDVMWKLA
jgi:hypothetical protein